jgi:hypothetical protein
MTPQIEPEWINPYSASKCPLTPRKKQANHYFEWHAICDGLLDKPITHAWLNKAGKMAEDEKANWQGPFIRESRGEISLKYVLNSDIFPFLVISPVRRGGMWLVWLRAYKFSPGRIHACPTYPSIVWSFFCCVALNSPKSRRFGFPCWFHERYIDHWTTK